MNLDLPATPRRPIPRVPTLEDLPDPSGRSVLVRATLDLPFGADRHEPMAAHRAGGLGATLDWLAQHGARVTVCGDAGAPDAGSEAERFARVRQVVQSLSPGVEVADNTSGGGESAEDPRVIENLVASHDLFVNDAFQSSYLPLPSLVLPPQRLPSAVGRSVEHDLATVERLLDQPERPLVAVLGGDRSFLRLHGLAGLILRADTVLVGGPMALPLLEAVGKLPVDGISSDFLAECRSVYGMARRVHHRVQLPYDLVWAGDDGEAEILPPERRGRGRVVDIGPLTRLRFGEILHGAGTILWTGALGRVEDPRFGDGTRALAAHLGAPAGAVVGGDALVRFLDDEGLLRPGTDVVGATDSALELLKNGDLPALVALRSGL